MTALGADTFTRSNQSGWGTASDGQSWNLVSGPATTSIVSNRGRIGNFNAYTIYRIGSGTSANIDVEVSVKLADSALNGAGIAWRVADIDNGYRCITFDNSVYIDKYVSGTKTNITSAFIGFGASDEMRMRVQHIGSALKVKFWNLSGSEPTSWAIEITENSITGAGYYGLVSDLFGGSGTGEMQYWNLAITDGASSVPASKKYSSRFYHMAGASKKYSARFFQMTGVSKIWSSRFFQSALASKKFTGRFYQLVGTNKKYAARLYQSIIASKIFASRFSQMSGSAKKFSSRFNQPALISKKFNARLYHTVLQKQNYTARFYHHDRAGKLFKSRYFHATLSKKIFTARFDQSKALAQKRFSCRFYHGTDIEIPAMHITWVTDDMTLAWQTDDMSIDWRTED